MNEVEKILIVDDNKDLLQILQIILKGQGYHTVLASSIQEAEHKIRIHKPVLILLDICFCDSDGSEFCDRIKHDADLGHMKVILMSGLDDLKSDWTCCGADDFLLKPFDYQELVTKVQQQYELALSVTAH